ncbi:hypothetical protein CHS0354_000214 [Potamilus streckersoni]|uniref:Uncharacterized protein n=1 Tax=Potamilus streckersoni TaxID=2493646 RepID=A0AAE0RQJ2_9BIVA|nr:hypothetical protein CHS0354_000214 [Potamilus streckersoni]
MIYKLPLGLFLIVVGPYCIQSQDVITDKNVIKEDEPSLSLLDTFVQKSVTKDAITAANTWCKHDTKCGYHQSTRYSWCNTNYGWEYCCTDACITDPEFDAWMRCSSGKRTVACGNPGNRTVTGKSCLPSHGCGAHEGVSDYFHKYWCYINAKKEWEYCCSPLSQCRDRKDGYGNWCYHGTAIYKSQWVHCTP